MGYVIGLDIGTTYTAAAVTDGDGRPEIVQLGSRAAAVPSVVFLHEATVLTGDAALRRGLSEPGRLAREFKRRVGDPAPILLGGVPLSAETLFGRLLAWTVDVVSEREGAPPSRVAVCHPANWGPYKLELLAQATRIAGLEDVTAITEPEAAAIQYAALERVEPGALVAVYDLGGGTFDAAVLRKTEVGFEILGTPEGIERLGGIDFDEAVVAHVRAAVGEALAGLDLEAPATVVALSRLRQECVEAKEALSADVETSIPVMLPGLQTEVRLTRGEFESMIRVPLLETIAALRRALRNASVEPEELTAVLLVGGSSRIPMVAELVGAELRRPVAVDADPKYVVALGAARAAALDARTAVQEESPILPVARSAPAGTEEIAVAAAPPEETAPAAPPSQPAAPPPAEPPPEHARARSRKWLLAIVATVLVLGVGGAVAAVLATRGGGDGGNGVNGWVSSCPAAGSPAACITSISYADDDLVVEFTTQDLDAAQATFGDEQIGTVFFLASISESQAASIIGQGRTDAWGAWGLQSPFTGTNSAGQQGLTAGQISSDATALCVLLGDTAGRVVVDTGNCAQLPPKPAG